MIEKDRQVGSNVSLEKSLTKKERRRKTENRGRYSILFSIKLSLYANNAKQSS